MTKEILVLVAAVVVVLCDALILGTQTWRHLVPNVLI